MSLYDGIKDVAKIVQQADSIDLYKRLLDLSAQALDLQAENARLKEENAELKKGVDYESRILRHHQPYLTLDGETPTAFYCSVCWGKDKKLIQMRDVSETDYSCRNLYCIVCNNRCRLDNE